MAISRALVTGGGGFVGSALVPRMLDAVYEVTAVGVRVDLAPSAIGSVQLCNWGQS